jgi:peptidyl-prolyl cis-trans isomerase C
MKRMTKSLVLLLVGAGLTVGRAPAAEPATTNAAAKPDAKISDLFAGTVVAKGKGFEIKRSQLDEDVIRAKSQLAANGHPVPPEQTVQVERQILEQMINVQLLQSKATDADKATAKATAEKRFADVRTKLGSDEALNRQLTLMGSTREEVLSKWTEALTAETAAKRELKVNITDADAKKYYDDNPARFEKPESVRASHILLTTRDASTGAELSDEKKLAKHKEMEGLLKRARAGEDFAKLAKEFSEDPGSKDKGGEYTFPRGQMVPEFEAAAFSLKTNQVSDIVTTSYGYHIIKLSEKIPAKKVAYADAAADIKEGLAQQAMQKELPDYLRKLRKEAGVEILDEKLRPVETSDTLGLPAGHPPVTADKKSDAK